MYIWRKNH